MKDISKALLILLLLAFLAIIHLTFQTQNIALKYETAEIKMKINKLRNENRQAQAEIARNTNLAKVRQYAEEKLNMAYPAEMNYIIVTDEVK